MAEQVIIGLGSNMDEPFLQMSVATAELRNIPAFQNFKISSFYESKPVGPQDQPNFINAVASFKTELSPVQVLDILQALEQKHRRERLVHWGPRTLDLDILFFGEQEIDSERLRIPHPEFSARVFTVVPLLELIPDFEYKGQPLSQILTTLPAEDLKALKKMAAV